jgi:hypothetical protein
MSFYSKRRWFLLSYPIHIAALSVVLIPFIRFNNLLEWDFPGHFAAIWHLKEHLLPWPSGWNSFFYAGYPQGVFYPPLAHYLAALLSYPLGIAGAMKGLICLSILLLPAAFYYFSRRWGLDDFRAAVCATWMTALLFLCGEMFGSINFGSDLKSILNIGLFANALSLPVLFFFLGCFGGEQPLNRWKPAALLLGVLILIHPLSTLIAGIFWLSLGINHLMSGAQRRTWGVFLKILGFGFMVGALWIIPFIARRGYMNPEFVHSNWSPALQFVVINGIVLALACFSKTHLRPLTITCIILANFIVIGTMWRLSIQFPRLTIYLIFLIPIFLLTWLKSRFLVLSTAALAIGMGLYGYLNSGIHPKGVPDFSMPDFGKVQGRILSVAPSTHLPSYHVHHDLIPVRTGNEAILGLFIESGINGRFMGNLTRIIDPRAYVWGTPTEHIKPEALAENYGPYVRDRLRLFGISYIYTDLKLEKTLDPALAQTKRFINSYPAPRFKSLQEFEDLSRRYNMHGDLLDFYLYPVGDSALAEALPYVPKNPSSDWKMTNTIWFTQLQGVPIFTDTPVPSTCRGATPEERVEVLEKSPNSDRLVLQVHAQQDIPVLVKIGYFPNWTLKIDGKAAQIYRASPDLMLFFGKGRAVLEYQQSWVEYIGLLLSLCGLVLLVILK